MTKQCFNNEFMEIAIEKLTYSKVLPDNVKLSFKYRQILASIKEIGLVEPVIIFITGAGKVMKILDGHLRLEAMKDLSFDKISCIISTIDDSYTPNKCVNRLTVLHEHKMIKKAIESGVSIDKLSSALGISAEVIRSRFNIAKGINDDVAYILADKHVPVCTFDILRKMKPVRQIEVANIMINFDNYTVKFAQSLLHATEAKLMVEPKKKDSSGMTENLARLEREMASVQVETDNIKSNYAEKTLQLLIVRNHIKKLLSNSAVLMWLLENKPDYLNLLKKISDIDSINNS